MDVKVNVREYRQSDYDRVNKIWMDTEMGGKIRGDNEGVIQKTVNAGGKLFVLERMDNEEIIGTSWLTHDNRRIYLHHFAIDPAHQGKGYAHHLMEASMQYARSTGMQIKLEVHRNNFRAIELYKKWGFNYLGDYDVYIIRDYGKSVKLNEKLG